MVELPRSSLSLADEAVVVALAVAGDRPAFDELVRRRQSSIRNLLRRLCRDAALADDLSQVAFVQAWRSLQSLKSPRAFGSWLRKLTVNVWLQHIRRRRGPTGRDPSEVPLDRCTEGRRSDETGREANVAEQLDLDHALSLLPPDVRLCIVLAYAERMSHREICDATGFPLGTVKSHIARGAARLRETLDAYR